MLMKCVHCGSDDVEKVISYLMPMKYCHECFNLWGEPFAFIYTYFIGPIEGFIFGHFNFMSYNCSYLEAAYHYIKGDYLKED
jgi:hypothetical protein